MIQSNNHDKNNNNAFLKSGLLISLMTFISRIFGLLRDIIIARYFGASISSDAFFVAFRIPNFLRRLFAEGAFSQAFVPILAQSKANESDAETQILINHIGVYLLKKLVIVTVIAIVLSPLIILLFAFGFYNEPEKFALASYMLKITFPYLLLISLVAFSGAILNTYHKFAAIAFTPVLLNISLILCALYLKDYFNPPIVVLAWGVLLGGILQLLFQIPFLKRIGKLPKFPLRIKRQHRAIQQLKKRILPAIFGVSVAQINLLVDTIIASFLVTGSISWLYYADRLLELPLALIGISLATLSLAKLSNYFASAEHENFKQALHKALSIALIVGLPAMFGLILLAEPMLNTLFAYGHFSTEDARQSALALVAYSIGLVALIFIKILAPAFYATGNMKTPVKVGVVAMLANIIFNLIFVYFLNHVGLALATSVSAFINAFLLYYFLFKNHIYRLPKIFYRLVLKSLSAAIIMTIIVYYFSFSAILSTHFWENFIYLSLQILVGIVSYSLCLYLIGGFKTFQYLLKP